ncbi:TetR family transcriptional regulator [Lacibacterium aquatile]|uniref:TetR family transcriptional regulator n=1 Tax=Lacibacterium aquatile TaxID=1168082 RepID=A0ABW5DPQ2_9PROT
MNDTVLTPTKILDTAEDVLRRFGPTKTTVVDVARALGVSHGSVYRHFASKAELRNAVAERWLLRVSDPLEEFATAKGPALDRLHRWFHALMTSKRQKVGADPEMFATYSALASESGDVIAEHIAHLQGQIARILQDGIDAREIAPMDAGATAQAIFRATSFYHHPMHATAWSDPGIDRSFEALWRLLVKGLMPR